MRREPRKGRTRGEFSIDLESRMELEKESRETAESVNMRIDFGGASFGTETRGFTKNDTLYLKIVNRWVKTDLTDRMWHQSDPLTVILPALNDGEKEYSGSDSLGYHNLRVRSKETIRAILDRASFMAGRRVSLVSINDHVMRVGVDSDCYIEGSTLALDAVIDYNGVSVRTDFEYEWHFSEINEAVDVEIPDAARQGRYVHPRMMNAGRSETSL